MRVVFGVVKDKEIENIIPLLPQKSHLLHYATQCSSCFIPVDELETVFKKFSLSYKKYSNVSDALRDAVADSKRNDLILITGSAFVVADGLMAYDKLK
ncbi:MAG: hypothetical protein KatS3mg027_1980 [Bacteroidia bacterium]|nr:MAG: hypothetical protein KatS3mg027_1980 [Bacteroidia bacterium]